MTRITKSRANILNNADSSANKAGGLAGKWMDDPIIYTPNWDIRDIRDTQPIRGIRYIQHIHYIHRIPKKPTLKELTVQLAGRLSLTMMILTLVLCLSSSHWKGILATLFRIFVSELCVFLRDALMALQRFRDPELERFLNRLLRR